MYFICNQHSKLVCSPKACLVSDGQKVLVNFVMNAKALYLAFCMFLAEATKAKVVMIRDFQQGVQPLL